MKKSELKQIIKEEIQALFESKPIKIKRGLKVKIKSADEIKKMFPGVTKGYLKYLLQIAGQEITIKRAFSSHAETGGRGGPLDEFEVDGVDLYGGYSGFDRGIIDSIITSDTLEKDNTPQ